MVTKIALMLINIMSNLSVVFNRSKAVAMSAVCGAGPQGETHSPRGFGGSCRPQTMHRSSKEARSLAGGLA